jgi:hypothetical protein
MQRWLAALLVMSSPAHALEIACGGYSPVLNDHVEWSIKVVGANADFDGQRFKVWQTGKVLILARPHSQIRIDKTRRSYVRLRNGKAIEWSRKMPGEGCDFSK